LPTISTHNHSSIQPGAERLCRQAESLSATLSEPGTSANRTVTSSDELVVDGYARVLALDVSRLKLEREIARLAELGDPEMAGELRKLSALLRRVTRASDELRSRLDALRAQAKPPGQG
jgi:hypothetical protein